MLVCPKDLGLDLIAQSLKLLGNELFDFTTFDVGDARYVLK